MHFFGRTQLSAGPQCFSLTCNFYANFKRLKKKHTGKQFPEKNFAGMQVNRDYVSFFVGNVQAWDGEKHSPFLNKRTT